MEKRDSTYENVCDEHRNSRLRVHIRFAGVEGSCNQTSLMEKNGGMLRVCLSRHAPSEDGCWHDILVLATNNIIICSSNYTLNPESSEQNNVASGSEIGEL